MQRKILNLFLVLFCLTGSLSLHATHNRAGDITYKQIGELEVEVTVTTYTKSTSVQADRDSILVQWGDGSSEFIKRSNGQGEDLGGNVQKNLYTAIHNYPGRAKYKIEFTDPNRVAEIQNLNFPYSEGLKFYLYTEFEFLNSVFNGFNSSVQLLQAPIDVACIDQTFIHLPNAYDVDGDSIAFVISQPRGEDGEIIDDYQYPNEIIPNGNDFDFDIEDGKIVWNSPKKAGEYNVAFLVQEYRNGQKITEMLRDMQIFVLDCNDTPPVIDVIDEICVVAGETVQFDVVVSDIDAGQQVLLEATGAPFLITPNTATFDAPEGYVDPILTSTFTWNTRCEDISDNYYQVVFRAVDDFFMTPTVTTGLADLKSVKILVVGPEPEDLQATAEKDKINLDWEKPYSCEITEKMFFQGFSVWRNIGSINIPIDTCDPGIEGKGYTRIAIPEINFDGSRYIYQDQDNLEKGKTYCYRVVAEFAQISAAGFPYNFVQSLVSNEVCIQLPRDIPLLTEVSVQNTDNIAGSIQTRWIKPDPVALDTILNPGPYRYQLQRADGIAGTNFADIPTATFSTVFFGNPFEFSYLDQNVDTRSQGYNYRVAFYSDGVNNFYDNSPNSSSVFLEIKSSDEINILDWDSNTSWNNELYYIHKFDNDLGQYVLIDSTASKIYEDDELSNGTEYCYFVESSGSYQIPSFLDVLLNFSNEDCGIPLDTIPPCTPDLTVSNACENANETTPEEDFTNTLMWNRVDQSCPNSHDLKGYKVYFRYDINSDFQFLQEITDKEVISFDHKPELGLTACYAISSVDSLGNESPLSEFICINDCPSYILPNAFTPNADGSNDLFIPILNRFVSRIQMEVFNQWGQLVFETEDAAINWDGTNFSGSQLNDGVYYYTCNVFQNTVDGEIPFTFLKGYIQILKSN